MKILVYIQALNGVSFHRLINPYQRVKELSDISVSWLPQGADINKDNIADIVKDFDVFVFSRVMPDGYMEAVKTTKVKTVCDCDDYWKLDTTHPLYKSYQLNNTTEKILKHLKMSDYVTTTTQLLLDKIKPINSNVFIFENALTADGQFALNDKPHSGRLRLGIIGSSSHTYDMELLNGINSYLTDGDRENIEWVLCGFDKGMSNLYTNDGKYIKAVQTPWENVCWTQWEKMLTNDYKYVMESHKKWLQEYNVGEDDNSTDYYRRLWTREVDEYATFYDDIDVLVVPLQDTTFNRYKSNLKMVEAGIKNKGLIISNVEPYSPHIKNILSGDTFNLEGNCIAVKNRTRDFARAIKKILGNPDILPIMGNNLSNMVDESFNLNKITDKRIKFLREIWK